MPAASHADDDPVAIPAAPEARWIERLLWVFLLAFALDYRADEARAGGGGAGIDQLVFLAAALGSTGGILLLGWRHLLVRPGAWLLIFWASFLAFMLGNAVVQGVAPGRSLRIILPLCLCFAGMLNAHIAACAGVRPSRIVAPVFVAACTNVLWRMVHGFVFKDITLEIARVEVQSPANNWIAAWIGCSLMLRPRFHWTLLVACGVLFTGILITVTRSLLFPIAASAAASILCFTLGVRWGLHRFGEVPRRMIPVAAAIGLALFAVGVAALAKPFLIERWNERLFHHAEDRNISRDVSWLTREAEAKAIFKILNEDKIHYLFGHGIGASYYWDPAYLPELYLVYPSDEPLGDEVWFAGHSVWTYSLFSGGVIALGAYVLLLGGTMTSSLVAARANAARAGPDQWLAFLPFIAACCLISESATSNPFDERLAGLIFGVMVGLPQCFFVRASLIRRSPSHG